MKKLLLLLSLLWSVGASAQFVPGQVLTAAELNSQFALYAPLAGATFTGGVSGTTFAGSFSGPLNGSVGAVTPSTGSFTNLTATGIVTLPAISLSALATQAANTIVANATGSTASPTAIAVPSCSTSSSALNWTTSGGASAIACNTAINAATLGGSTFASPPAAGYGSTTPEPINATSVTASGATILNGGLQMGAGTTIVPTTTFGIKGTTAGDNANAGSIGEYITATTSGVALTNGSTSNVTSISLTAGDWDVQAIVQFIGAASTTSSNVQAGVSTVSATFGALGTFFQDNTPNVTQETSAFSTPTVRINVTSTTTVYAVAEANFSVSTMTANGVIRARRVR